MEKEGYKLRFSCDPRRADAISANGRTFPLASDLTTPLAYMIAKAPEPASIRAMFNVNIWQQQQGLHMLQPYQPGRIPVVFVHGLMSSPIAWLQMLNTVMGDPVLNKRYQFWFFMYPTGNPVLYSASLLRASLHTMQRIYDPAGRDPAFSNMVVVSHSMGGLLARFIVQDSSPEYWNCLGNQPFDAYHLTPDEATLISNLLFFTAVPYVARVAFLATPHRGSPYADTWYARIGAHITSVQQNLVAVGDKLLPVLARQTGDANTKRDLVLDLGRIPTGIDSLRPENPVLKISVALPFAPRVVYHSIIGNEAAANTPGGTDGIVPYWSSHLDGAASEMIVKSDHSVEVNPRAILEVRRLLLEHLAQTP
ncbi:MAG: hypothetical protein NTV22_15745 [bacterium]|nr:hypothetical protein [bacterium]